MTDAQQVVERLDPRTLLVDLNIRDAKPDKGLISSIKALGVLEPVTAYRTADGDVRVRFGHRRTLAAIDAGLPDIPVIVMGEEEAGDQATIARMIGQRDENTHRAGLTAAEDAGFVAEMLDLGMSAATVSRRARIPKSQVAAAQAVNGSETARKAAAEHPLSLDQAAGIAEFEDNPEAVKLLIEAAGYGEGKFRHELEKLRAARVEWEARSAATAELEATGVKVTDRYPHYENFLDSLAGSDGNRLTPETHKDCPGHSAYLQSWYDHQTSQTEFKARYFCTDPKANGHRTYKTGTDGQGQSEADAKAARAKTIAGNREWRAAEKVRREWLTTFLAGSKPPAGAMRLIIEAVASGNRPLVREMQRSQKMARTLLGIELADLEWASLGAMAPVIDAVEKAGDDRALMIGLGLILGAFEASTDVNNWQSPKSHSDIADYFEVLVGWGYYLSEIEQTVVDANPPAEPSDDHADTDETAAA